MEWKSENDSSIIHWRRVGKGENNLLLIHGFGPVTEMQWEEVVKILHADFTIYIPDLIYFGESSSITKNYDPRFIVRQIYHSLTDQNLHKIYIAGISYGGMISSIFAHEYPDLTEGLILIDALSKFLDKNHSDSLANALGYKNINEILIPTDGKSFKALLQISFYKSKQYPAWLLNKPSRILFSNQRNEKEGLLNYLSVNEIDLKSIDIFYNGKVHIIWGKEDLLIPLSTAYELKKLYKTSNLTILPNVGHVANMESPEKVAQIIKQLSL
jgi:pimeloyl-ACP methyl ester carboxylesterase